MQVNKKYLHLQYNVLLMEKKRKQFTFAETKTTKGLVEKIDKLAAKAKRNRNDYLNIILARHVQDANETAEED